MITFKDVEIGVNSARMTMGAYLTQQTMMSADHRIYFNDKALSLDVFYEDGCYAPAKLVSIELTEAASGNKELFVNVIFNEVEEAWGLSEISSNDLYGICHMVHGITNDEMPNIGMVEKEVVDLPEEDYEELI